MTPGNDNPRLDVDTGEVMPPRPLLDLAIGAAVVCAVIAIPGGIGLALYLDAGWPLWFTVIGLILGLAG